MASGWNDVADLFPGMDGGDIVDAHNYEVPPRPGSWGGSGFHRAQAVGRRVQLRRPAFRKRTEDSSRSKVSSCWEVSVELSSGLGP